MSRKIYLEKVDGHYVLATESPWPEKSSQDSLLILEEVHKLLVWAADSFASHAKVAESPDFIDEYLGSELMYREAADRLKSHMSETLCQSVEAKEITQEISETLFKASLLRHLEEYD